jgi:DNA mismatch endonuclease (patch repair protein)
MLGKPDFLIPPNIVVFCDGSFWHGRDWNALRLRLTKGYWFDHIRKNRLRDRKVRTELRKQKYIVLRFWDTEIEKDIQMCVKKIKEAKESMSNSALAGE